MRNAVLGATVVLLGAIPATANAQIGTDAAAGTGVGTATAAPPPATLGGITGPAIGTTRPFYRDYAHRDRLCWHDRGYRHCRWR